MNRKSNNFTRNWLIQTNTRRSPLRHYSQFLLFPFIAHLLASSVIASENVINSNNFRVRLHQIQSSTLTSNDVGAEIRFGQEVAARILSITPLFKHDELNKYINLIGHSLALNGPRTEIQYHFAILDSEKLNAYSAPGGYIFITVGLVKLAQDESELAAVLAHEIAHINQRHIVNDLNIRGSSQEKLSGLARFIGATASTTQVAFSQAVDEAIKRLFDTGYQHNQELDADKVALRLLANTGYDSTALVRILQQISKRAENDASASKTHPTFEKRFTNLTAQISQENLAGGKLNKASLRFSNRTKDYFPPTVQP